MKCYFALFLIVLVVSNGIVVAKEPLPFRDTSLPLEVRLDDLMGRLSLEEKAVLFNHRGPTLERLDIRSDQWNQCLNGVKWNRPTTMFPTCIAMSASWNKELVREIADTLSDEARAIYNGWHLDPEAPGEHKGLIYRAPVINIGRNPYWGRNHEAWGEDPFLTGRMAVAYVQGLQGNDPKHLKLAATLKHYAVNNVETDRHTLDAKVSERMMREYWLPHFKDAVVEGKAESLMASYNAINGQPNTINHWLLTDLLKTEWKHAGFVVSDLGGVKKMVEGHEAGKMSYVDAVAQGIMAGCDFSDLEYQKHIPAAVREGKLTMDRLDDALRRVLRSRMKLGEFDPFDSVSYSKISPQVVNSKPHHAIALKAARESIVLLKNTGLLPLDRTAVKRIAVIGPLADAVLTNNYNGKHIDCVTALAGIRNRAGAGMEVVTAKGCETGEASRARKIPVQVDNEPGFSGGAGWKIQTSGIDQFVEFNVPNDNPGPYQVTMFYKSGPNRGMIRMSHDGDPIGEVIDQYASTSEYGKSASLGIVKFQTAGPKKLRFTVAGKRAPSSGFTASLDKIVLVARSGARFEHEFESLKPATGELQLGDGIAEAADLAKEADVAILCIGTDRTIEQEGRDRKTLGLTGKQEALVKAVIAANPNTVVVQMSAGPLTVPWLKENASAMLQSWWGGQEAGNALADVLFGMVNPAGRLPHTIYASESQVPPISEYDITRGFTYLYLKGPPLYAFGHGLSYTSFRYDHLNLSESTINATGSLEISVDITNTGQRAGDEVPQLYFRDLECSVPRPHKELRGFERITLKPGEKRRVSFTLPADRLAFWDERTHAFLTEPGKFEVMIGASSDDIRVREEFTVK
jgi:beta-glucosidase